VGLTIGLSHGHFYAGFLALAAGSPHGR